jgi:hypothetical protein
MPTRRATVAKSKGKSEKRKKLLAEKKARKLAGYKKPGNSKYALKRKAQARGKYSPRSPFHAVEDKPAPNVEAA